MFTAPEPVSRLPYPYLDEAEVLTALVAPLAGTLDWNRAVELARPWVQAVRDKPAPFWAMESLLREYPISSDDTPAEGARTEADAKRYLASYRNAIEAIAAGKVAPAPESADGISIKLSALFSRYEDAQRERVFAELLPRVWQLIELAARANINLTIDAEECDRLELSLDVFEALAARLARSFPQWRGFGLAVQSYQTRALHLVDEVARIARTHGLRFM